MEQKMVMGAAEGISAEGFRRTMLELRYSLHEMISLLS